MLAKKFQWLIVLFPCFVANAQPMDGNIYHGIPIIWIDTENGAPIQDKINYVPMQFALTDQNNPSNNISLTAKDFSEGGIRGRGNSTWWSGPKKPYKIKFNKKQSLFGLEKAKSWILLANYFDLTLIKNSFAFELGHRLGVPYTSSYHYVELYLNGEYRGNYMLTEHKEVAPGRVDIDPIEGWFVEIDRSYDELPKFRTKSYSLPIMIKSPDFGTNSADSRYDFVKNDLNELCDSMASVNFPENGYRDFIDMKSIINYFLVNSITFNGDFNLPGSLYFHKDKGGKISGGILWDFDTGFGFSWEDLPVYIINDNTHIIPYPINIFLNRFFKDPLFLVKWKENWNNNFSVISSMTQFIDDMSGEIRESALENYKKWRYNGHYPTVNFDYWIEEMKEYYNKRIDYLNEEYNKIDVLPKYKWFTTIAPQTFTLVAHGDITELSATLQNADSSDFEISTELNKQATGNGGYLATVSVKPKKSLSMSDYLILKATNQGNKFSFKVPLSFHVDTKVDSSSAIRLPQVASGNIRAQSISNAIILSNLPSNAKVEVYNLQGKRIYSTYSENSQILKIQVTKGMYVVKIKFGNREKHGLDNILRVTVM